MAIFIVIQYAVEKYKGIIFEEPNQVKETTSLFLRNIIDKHHE